MNKLGLLLCFLLAFSYSKSEDIDGIDPSMVYDQLISVTKGMAQTNEYKCSNTLKNNRDKIFPKFESIIKSLKNENDFMSELFKSGLSLLTVIEPKDCNLYDIIAKFPNLLKAEGIKDMGKNMMNHAGEIEGLINEFKKATDKEGKLIATGKIIKVITGIFVN